jgi:hypothetical protein
MAGDVLALEAGLGCRWAMLNRLEAGAVSPPVGRRFEHSCISLPRWVSALLHHDVATSALPCPALPYPTLLPSTPAVGRQPDSSPAQSPTTAHTHTPTHPDTDSTCQRTRFALRLLSSGHAPTARPVPAQVVAVRWATATTASKTRPNQDHDRHHLHHTAATAACDRRPTPCCGAPSTQPRPRRPSPRLSRVRAPLSLSPLCALCSVLA